MTTDDHLIESGRHWSKAWCPSCCAVQAFAIEYLPVTAWQPQDALDVICLTCRTILMTLHASHAPAMVES